MLKMKFVSLFILFLLLLVACDSDSVTASSETSQIEFTEALSLEETEAFARAHDITLNQLVHTYKVNGEEVVGFLPLDEGQTIVSVTESWPETFKGFMSDMGYASARVSPVSEKAS